MDNVVDFNSRNSASRVSEVLVAIEIQVAKVFNETFAATLAGCDDALYARAERATNGNLQAHHFDDLRVFREHQADAILRFRHACRGAFRHYRGDPAIDAAADKLDAEMQLVDHDDLELDLAMFRIGKRCDEAAPRLRHQVQRRFQVLLGLADDTPSPLCGVGIARMCRAGITALGIGIEARLIVLKRLELRFSEIAEQALDQANDILVAHGVLPNLRSTPTRSTTGGSRPASAGAQANAVAINSEAPAHAASPSADINEVVAQVAQWLARQTPAEFAQVFAEPVAQPTPVVSPIFAGVEQMPASSEMDVARERRRAEIAERRAVEIERARVQRITAERSTDSVIAAVVAQPHVPQPIRDVLEGPLRRHLEIVYSRRGEGSTEWRSARKLVNDIAWSLDPETFRAERLHWSEVFPDIVRTLRAALATAGVLDHNAARIVSEFSCRCEEMNAAAHAADIASAALENAPQATEETVPARVEAPSFADALARVRRYMVGQWVEMIDDQGLLQRAKLVWTSAMTGRCLFVNGNGKLVADRPHARIAADVIAGSFRELDGMVSA